MQEKSHPVQVKEPYGKSKRLLVYNVHLPRMSECGYGSI